MTSSLLLGEYPRAILETDRYVSLLAVLERRGGCDEDELAAAANMDRATVAAAVVTLHKNHLLDVVRDLVSISHRGKLLLDRFRLDEQIVDDVLDGMPPVRQRKEWKQLLLHYREDAFGKYLSSLRTLRAWQFIDGAAGSSLKEQTASEYRDRGVLIVGLALLTRDLVDWLHAPTSDKRRMDDATLHRLWQIESDFDSEGNWSAADHCLKELRPHRWLNASHPEPNFRLQFRGYLDKALLFDSLQTGCDDALWNSTWLGLKRSKLAGADLWTTLAKVIEDYAVASKRLGVTAVDETSGDVHVSGRSDIFGALLGTRSFDAFVSSTGLNAVEAKDLLTNVRERCQQLIDSATSADSENRAPSV